MNPIGLNLLGLCLVAWGSWLVGSVGAVEVERLVSAIGRLPVPGPGVHGIGGPRVGAVARLRRHDSRSHRRDSARLTAALQSLAADLEAGVPAATALQRAGEAHVWLAGAAAAARVGADVPDAFSANARRHRSPALAALGACWLVSSNAGAALAPGVRRSAQIAVVELRLQDRVESELAAPRATGRLLAVLPALGIAFGQMLGADPVPWLLGSPSGRWAAALGGFLTATGMWWSSRIVSAALPRASS